MRRGEAVAVVTKTNQKAPGGNDLFLLQFVYFHLQHTRKEYTCAAASTQTHTRTHTHSCINAHNAYTHKCADACTHRQTLPL